MTRFSQNRNLFFDAAFSLYGKGDHPKLALLKYWRAVVGESLAKQCQISRIVDHRAITTGDKKQKRQQCTLHIACQQGASLELSYREGEITSQINEYFGFDKIRALKYRENPNFNNNLNARHKPKIAGQLRFASLTRQWNASQRVSQQHAANDPLQQALGEMQFLIRSRKLANTR